MANAQELVKKLGQKETAKKKEYSRASEWPKCSKPGCPLWTTIKEASPTCGHHHRTHGMEADCITEAIKEFVPYLNKYKEMVYWDVRTWREREAQIMGWEVLPATKHEMDNPTLYLNRFKSWIDKGIKERAEEIYQGY